MEVLFELRFFIGSASEPVVGMKLSKDFMQYFSYIEMFGTLLRGNFKDTSERCLDIRHPKLNKSIVLAYMKHLRYRLIRKLIETDAGTKDYQNLVDFLLRRSSQEQLTKELKDPDPVTGTSPYVAALANYLGDPMFEQGYYPGEIIMLYPYDMLPEYERQPMEFRKHRLDLDPVAIKLRPGYKTQSEIVLNLIDQIPPGIIVKIREGSVYLAVDQKSERLYDVDAKTFNRRVVCVKIIEHSEHGWTHEYESKEIRLDFDLQFPLLNGTVDEDFPSELTEWSATEVAERYIDRIAAEPCVPYRKLANFVSRNPKIAKIVWDSDKEALLNILDVPHGSYNKILKLKFDEIFEYADRFASSFDKTHVFDDQELEKIAQKLKILRDKFYGSHLWNEYKKIMRTTTATGRDRIKYSERLDPDNSPFWVFDDIQRLEQRWNERYYQLEQKMPKGVRVTPAWVKRGTAPIL